MKNEQNNDLKHPIKIWNIVQKCLFCMLFVTLILIFVLVGRIYLWNNQAIYDYIGNIDGTNWSGWISGYLHLTLDEFNYTARIDTNTNYRAYYLVIPRFVTNQEQTQLYKLTKICDSAFKNNSNLLGTIVFSDYLLICEAQAFYGCNGLLGELLIPNNLTTIGDLAFGMTKFSQLKNNYGKIGNTPYYVIGLGEVKILYSKETYDGGKIIGSIAIGNDLIFNSQIAEINEYSFDGCSGIGESLTLTQTITVIGAYAFNNCVSIKTTYCYGLTAQPATWAENWNANFNGGIGDNIHWIT